MKQHITSDVTPPSTNITTYLLAAVVLLGFSFRLDAPFEEGSILNAPTPPSPPTPALIPPPVAVPTLPKLKGAF